MNEFLLETPTRALDLSMVIFHTPSRSTQPFPSPTPSIRLDESDISPLLRANAPPSRSLFNSNKINTNMSILVTNQVRIMDLLKILQKEVEQNTHKIGKIKKKKSTEKIKMAKKIVEVRIIFLTF